jgi:uncharacterized protein
MSGVALDSEKSSRTGLALRVDGERRAFGNLIAFRSSENKIIGYHVDNMQVAELDPVIWDALAKAPLTDAANNSQAWDEIVSWSQEKNLDVKDAHIEQKVRALTINISQICNLKCTYCAAGGDGTYGSNVKRIDISKVTPQIELLFKRLKDNENFAIHFLGGEPLIYPEAILAITDFTDALAKPRRIKVRYEITTNATLVNSEVAKMLADMKCHVTVSLDGPAEINDVVRPSAGGKGSTAKTLSGVVELFRVKERLGSLSVHSVFGSHNTNVLRTYIYMQSFDWDVIHFTFASGPDDEIYSPLFVDEMNRTAAYAYGFGGEVALRKISQFNHYFDILDSQKRMHNYCGAGKSLLQVDTSGKFYACNWFVGDPAEELGSGLNLDAEKLSKYAKPLLELNSCGDCWAKHICGGGCMFVHRSRTQDKHKKDPEFCNRTRSLITKGIEYYEKSRIQQV